MRRASRLSNRWLLIVCASAVVVAGRPTSGQGDAPSPGGSADRRRGRARHHRRARGHRWRGQACRPQELRRHRPHPSGARRQPRADRVRDPGGAARQVCAARRVPRSGCRPDGHRFQRRPFRAESGSSAAPRASRRSAAAHAAAARGGRARPARQRQAGVRPADARPVCGVVSEPSPHVRLRGAGRGAAGARRRARCERPRQLRGAALRGRQDAPAGHAQLAGTAGARTRPRSRSARPAVAGPAVLHPGALLLLALRLAAAPPAAAPPAGGPPPVENRLYFAEYRSFDGLQLPTRVRRAVAGDTTEETTFDRFRINARVDPRRFEPGS